MIRNDVASLLKLIEKELPREEWKPWPGGWPDQIESALIDAVLSIRARYGSEGTGVRAAVKRYQQSIGEDAPNDLARLADQEPEELQEVLNDQLTSGRTKTSAIVEAANGLVQTGVLSAAELDPMNPDQRTAYTSVHGLGSVTWDYLGMLLGKPGVKADTWITRIVSRAVGREVSSPEARNVVKAAAKELKVGATELDHALWYHERTREAGLEHDES